MSEKLAQLKKDMKSKKYMAQEYVTGFKPQSD